MARLTETLELHHRTTYVALFVILGGLLALSPAEATLGNVVKFVYLHGALERVAVLAYFAAGAVGIAHLVLKRAVFARWSRALALTALILWFGQFLISLPAQILAWGAIVWNEPRVVGAIAITALTGSLYVVAQWIQDARWVSLSAVANAVVVGIILGSAVNVVHPPNAILASNSIEMKLFYAAIVLVIGVLALQFAQDRATIGGA